MQEYQQRVIDEKDELHSKLKALGTFFNDPIYKKLRMFEKVALSRQFKVMDQYLQILAERISAFE